MREWLAQAVGRLEKGEPVVGIWVMESNGSTPRGAGSKMLVFADGTSYGTVGGGAVEYLAIKRAAGMLERGEPSVLEHYTLHQDSARRDGETTATGMVCGGDMTLFLQFIAPERREEMARLEQALQKEEKSWLVLQIGAAGDWRVHTYVPLKDMDSEVKFGKIQPLLTARGEFRQGEEESLFVEPLYKRGKVYVFGAGHVARELVPVLSHLGFRTVVTDDRAEFASKTYFPTADEIIVEKYQEIFKHTAIYPEDVLCIMTRGHQHDYLVQKEALKTAAHYIGVMGSRRKIQAITELLLKDGFAREQIKRCHMPIGTDILAETPAEIAISVAGELIRDRAVFEQREKSKSCPS